jgi:hypothetical protein
VACRWMHDPKIGRWWYPQCIGGIYGKEGCTCHHSRKDRVEVLEKRVEKLERQLAAVMQSNGIREGK